MSGPTRVDAGSTVPWHLRLIAGLGLAWNGIAVFDYVMTQTRNAIVVGGFTPAQLAALEALPAWVTGCWALAVWGGALGCALLMLRRHAAEPVLLLSLGAMTITAVHNATAEGGLYATGGSGPGFVGLIFVIALGLWVYARMMRVRGLLR
jgi:hypothetical protein